MFCLLFLPVFYFIPILSYFFTGTFFYYIYLNYAQVPNYDDHESVLSDGRHRLKNRGDVRVGTRMCLLYSVLLFVQIALTHIINRYLGISYCKKC